MAGRRFDPHQQVVSALNKRRGFIDQAEIREQQRSVARLDALGEKVEDITGPQNIFGDQTITEGLLRVEVANDSTGAPDEGLIVGPVYEEGIGDYYTLSYTRIAGLYVLQLLNGGGFPTIKITQEGSGYSTIEVREGSVINFYDGVGALSASIDGFTGNITTVGGLTVGGFFDVTQYIKHFHEASSTPDVATTTTTYVTGGEITFTLPAGTWTLKAIGAINLLNSATDNMQMRLVVDGTAGAAESKGGSATSARQLTSNVDKTGVASGSRTVTLEYKGSSGTTTAQSWWLIVWCQRTA